MKRAPGITFRRTGGVNANGSVAGELSIGIQKWPTIDAMLDVWAALGGFKMWKRVTINVANNIFGNETKEEWIARREREQGLR
jgi:hypothetical protein